MSFISVPYIRDTKPQKSSCRLCCQRAPRVSPVNSATSQTYGLSGPSCTSLVLTDRPSDAQMTGKNPSNTTLQKSASIHFQMNCTAQNWTHWLIGCSRRIPVIGLPPSKSLKNRSYKKYFRRSLDWVGMTISTTTINTSKKTKSLSSWIAPIGPHPTSKPGKKMNLRNEQSPKNVSHSRNKYPNWNNKTHIYASTQKYAG